jgi:trk system potassium uptake protein TrkA
LLLNGDVSKPGILEQAKPSEADLFVAATDNDQVNIAITQRAKTEYGIPRIVSVANSPSSRERLQEAGADTVISPIDLALKDLENTFSMEHSTTIMYRPDVQLEVREITIPGDSSVMGQKLHDLKIPENVV